jgi:hypothetical protein
MRTSHIKLSLIVNLPNKDTIPWEFGERFFKTLVEADPRLFPEKLGWGGVNHPVRSIDDCKEHWGQIGKMGDMDGNGWRDFVQDTDMKRSKAPRFHGSFDHAFVNRRFDFVLGHCSLFCAVDKKIDWKALFIKLIALLKPPFASLHLATPRENNSQIYPQEYLEGMHFSHFNTGVHALGLRERGIPNLWWGMYFGAEHAGELDTGVLRANEFSAETIGEGHLVTVTNDLFDVKNRFDYFVERRAALKKLYRPGLVKLTQDPVFPSM